MQFASGHLDGAEYAIKFFLDRASFHHEQELYADANLQRMMPAVSDVVSNECEGAILTRFGLPLPPFIVVERGESLNEWAVRRSPDFLTSMVVRGLCSALLH